LFVPLWRVHRVVTPIGLIIWSVGASICIVGGVPYYCRL
jgi:hypothetical protein